MNKYIKKIESFKNLKRNWDSYDADIPNDRSIKYAKDIINIILDNGIKEISVVPDTEGGIYIEIEIKNNYLILDLYNIGNFTIAITDGKEEYPMVEELEPIEMLIVLKTILKGVKCQDLN